MARTARKVSKSGIYHVIFRGHDKRNLFYDEEDFTVFKNRLKLITEKTDCKIIAFCLMANHVHLIIKENENSLGEVMRKLLSSYVYWHNSKYERVGSLFQDRFKSEPIEDVKYLLHCVRFIFQNPIKAKLCKNIWEYKWSSAIQILNEEKSFVFDEIIKDVFQTKTYLIEFLEEKELLKFLEWENSARLTDERLAKKIEKVLHGTKVQDIINLEKNKRIKVLKIIMQINGATALQVSRLTGVSSYILRNLKK